jgi:hypothetical protein
MASEHEPSILSCVSTCLKEQTEAVTNLTEAIRLLSISISSNGTNLLIKPTTPETQQQTWWCRVRSHKSCGGVDKHGNILSANPRWRFAYSLESSRPLPRHRSACINLSWHFGPLSGAAIWTLSLVRKNNICANRGNRMCIMSIED